VFVGLFWLCIAILKAFFSFLGYFRTFSSDNIIGVTSYGALGHVPPLELGHVKIWQFLR